MSYLSERDWRQEKETEKEGERRPRERGGVQRENISLCLALSSHAFVSNQCLHGNNELKSSLQTTSNTSGGNWLNTHKNAQKHKHTLATVIEIVKRF